MDVNKYSKPTLPTAQHILEDLSDQNVIQLNEPTKLSGDDEVIQNAYTCFKNFKQLEEDLLRQSELSSNLDELNKKLVENINSMKKQAL